MASLKLYRGDLSAAWQGLWLTLPQAVAFAALAGMPVSSAIWASVLPAIVAALVGKEAHVVTGPASMLALTTGSILQVHFAPHTLYYVQAAFVLTAMMAVFEALLVFGGGLKVLAWMTPEAVRGITAGIGVAVVLSQVPVLLGMQGVPVYLPTWAQAWAAIVGVWNLAAVGTFVLSYGLALAGNRLPWAWLRVMRWPAAMLLASLATAGAGLQTIGTLHIGVPFVGFKVLHPSIVVSDIWPSLAGPALTMAFLALSQSWLVSQASHQPGEKGISVTREGYSQFLANAVGAVACAFPVAASVNRSLEHKRSGAKSWYSLVVSAIFVGIAATVAAPVVSTLALPALAALLVDVGVRMAKTAFKELHPETFVLMLAFVFLGLTQTLFAAVVAGLWRYAKKGKLASA